MPDYVRCADCGFVTLRSTETRQLVEVEAAIRESGNIPMIMVPRIGQQFIYEHDLICCVRAFPLREEFGNATGSLQERLRGVMDKSRECAQFTPWKQGFTPKEHREMMQEAELRKWQAEREDKDRKWREDQARLDHDWRQQDGDRSQQAIAQAHRHHIINLIVMGLLVTLVGAAAQLVAAFIELGAIGP